MGFTGKYPELLAAINQAQSGYVSAEKPFDLFNRMLENTLQITDSEYGFIGEIKRNSEQRFLKTHAITNIAWDANTRQFYDDNVENGLEFMNLSSLFGHVIRTGDFLIANDPKHHPEACGIPNGHPALNSFFGMPIFFAKEFIGMMGIANRPGGYEESMIEFLQPLLTTCGNIIWGFKLERERNEVKDLLASSRQNLLDAQRIAKMGNWRLNIDNLLCQCSDQALINFGLSTKQDNVLFDELISKLDDDAKTSLKNAVHELTSGSSKFHTHAKVNYPDDQELKVLEIDLELNSDSGTISGVVIDISERFRLASLKDQFISTVSHELRSPLTSIRGAIGMLSLDMSTFNEQQTHLIDICERNSERLLALVNDILDLSKLESDTIDINLSCVDLVPLVSQSLELNSSYADIYQVSFKLESSHTIPVLVDPERLEQVTTNLLSNAAKFSQPGQSILVRVEPSGQYVRVSVIDNGLGVPEDFRHNLFQKFQQADSTSTRRHAGTGLGLVICRNLIELMDGRIGYEPNPSGTGSVFYYELPICS